MCVRAASVRAAWAMNGALMWPAKVTGLTPAYSQTRELYSGRCASSISASSPPCECPTSAADGWPVKFAMKSSCAG